jgi:hypothetical protein
LHGIDADRLPQVQGLRGSGKGGLISDEVIEIAGITGFISKQASKSFSAIYSQTAAAVKDVDCKAHSGLL